MSQRTAAHNSRLLVCFFSLVLPAIGLGVRWLAAEKARVNLSVDLARGRDSTSLHVYVKESY